MVQRWPGGGGGVFLQGKRCLSEASCFPRKKATPPAAGPAQLPGWNSTRALGFLKKVNLRHKKTPARRLAFQIRGKATSEDLRLRKPQLPSGRTLPSGRS